MYQRDLPRGRRYWKLSLGKNAKPVRLVERSAQVTGDVGCQGIATMKVSFLKINIILVKGKGIYMFFKLSNMHFPVQSYTIF